MFLLELILSLIMDCFLCVCFSTWDDKRKVSQHSDQTKRKSLRLEWIRMWMWQDCMLECCCSVCVQDGCCEKSNNCKFCNWIFSRFIFYKSWVAMILITSPGKLVYPMQRELSQTKWKIFSFVTLKT